jgi:hypothetical protein
MKLSPPPRTARELWRVHRLLTDPRIAQRKEGIVQAAALVGPDQTVAHDWLRTIAAEDPMLTVREAAREALHPAAVPPGTTLDSNEQRYLITTRCPEGHNSQHDRRKLCAERRVLLRAGGASPADRILLHCPTCGREMVVEVDCGELP